MAEGGVTFPSQVSANLFGFASDGSPVPSPHTMHRRASRRESDAGEIMETGEGVVLKVVLHTLLLKMPRKELPVWTLMLQVMMQAPLTARRPTRVAQ